MSKPDEVVSLTETDFSEMMVKTTDETNLKIKKHNQKLAKFERQLSLLKLKERRRDTRKKSEFGGLVIKSKIDSYPKAVILGALIDALEQIENNDGALSLLQSKGEAAFMGYGDQENEPSTSTSTNTNK